MRKTVAALLAGVAFAVLGGVPVVAEQDVGMGLEGLHEHRREGGRVCMVDHFHLGSSNSQRSKKLAEAAAQRDWAGFTAWEYGGRWGNPRLAANPKFDCTQSSGSWGCSFEARPCRR